VQEIWLCQPAIDHLDYITYSAAGHSSSPDPTLSCEVGTACETGTLLCRSLLPSGY